MSWSGGKDSMLALHRAWEAGWQVEALLTMMDETGLRSRSHGLSRDLLQAQADALRLPLVTGRATWAGYEAEFIAQLRQLAGQGVQAVVFGDIDLQAHRDWEEKVCGRAGLVAQLPLWGMPRRPLVDEVLRLGYRARVVCVDASRLDASFCGREFDAGFLGDLPPDVDACGENGEFHTFVFDGPRFAHPVRHAVRRTHEIRPAPPASPATGHYVVAELGHLA